jgi:hypothetical protein
MARPETASVYAGGGAAASGAANYLCLAAAPTFAVMALLTGVSSGPADMLCAAGHGTSAWNGMAAMYALMSAFHAAPWLKLITRKEKHEVR